MAEKEIARFPGGVVRVGYEQGERVTEDRERLLERDAVLLEVGVGLGGIPFEPETPSPATLHRTRAVLTTP